jgi:hypothetical protein
MQSLDVTFQQPECMNNYIEDHSEIVLGPDSRITIEPTWDKLVQPADESEFDFSRNIKPILVNAQDGKLVIIDGRRRFLAYKKAKRRIPFQTESWSRLRAKDEFLKRHLLVG